MKDLIRLDGTLEARAPRKICKRLRHLNVSKDGDKEEKGWEESCWKRWATTALVVLQTLRKTVGSTRILTSFWVPLGSMLSRFSKTI